MPLEISAHPFAATRLLFDPQAVVQMDVRRGTAEAVLRLRLTELGAIDAS